MSTEVKKISLHHHAQILFWDIIIHLLSQSKLLRRCIQFIFPHKKKILPLFIILIAGCIIAGLINIPEVNATSSVKASVFTQKAGCTSPQCNYIVVHTRQLDEAQPELISIWIMFLSQTDNHQIIWKKISPEELPVLKNPTIADPLISPEGKLSKELVNNINALDIHWDGYLIIDDFTADQLMYWITGRKGRLSNMDEDNNHQVISEELRLTNNLCNHLSSGAPTAYTDEIQWETIYPNHLSMNIDFQEFVTLWNTYTNQPQPTHCEVLVK